MRVFRLMPGLRTAQPRAPSRPSSSSFTVPFSPPKSRGKERRRGTNNNSTHKIYNKAKPSQRSVGSSQHRLLLLQTAEGSCPRVAVGAHCPEGCGQRRHAARSPFPGVRDYCVSGSANAASVDRLKAMGNTHGAVRLSIAFELRGSVPFSRNGTCPYRMYLRCLPKSLCTCHPPQVACFPSWCTLGILATSSSPSALLPRVRVGFSPRYW